MTQRSRAPAWRGSFSPAATGSSGTIGRARAGAGSKRREPCRRRRRPLGARPTSQPTLNTMELSMAVTRTFSIIKPDATRRNLTGAETSKLEDAGLRIIASRRIHMTRDQAEGFYAVHRERPFFAD